MSIFDQLGSQLNEPALRGLSSRLGTDEGATSKAIAVGLPLLLGALARNASTPTGADSLFNAIRRDHDGAALDRPKPVLEGKRLSDGNAILGHVLGNQKGAAEQGVARASGLDVSKVGPLLAMLAPLVMASLGRAQRERNLDANGIAGLLGRERDEITDSGVMGNVTREVDTDRDRSFADSVSGLLGNLFGTRH